VIRQSETVTFDAAGQAWGRLASRVAVALRGKGSVRYAPNQLPAVRVVVTNITHVRISPRKRERRYYRFSGYPGGLKTQRFGERFDRDAAKAFQQTVRTMLPANRMRARILKHLKFD
jgi:large subunit ribosomal protein L13